MKPQSVRPIIVLSKKAYITAVSLVDWVPLETSTFNRLLPNTMLPNTTWKRKSPSLSKWSAWAVLHYQAETRRLPSQVEIEDVHHFPFHIQLKSHTGTTSTHRNNLPLTFRFLLSQLRKCCPSLYQLSVIPSYSYLPYTSKPKIVTFIPQKFFERASLRTSWKLGNQQFLNVP